MLYKKYQKILTCLVVSSIGLMPLAACSKEKAQDKKDRFSYTLSIDPKGVPVVVDARGNPIQAKKIEPPVDAKKIVRVRTFSVMDIEGSHYILIDIGGSLYRINLPD